MFIFIFLFVICLSIIFLFSSSKLSPIPYFPTNAKDLPLILKALKLKDDQVIYDLGAGDGLVIFNAASLAFKQKLNTQFIAVEINPVLVLIFHIKRLFHPNRNNIKIVWEDMFSLKFEIPASPAKRGERNSKFEIIYYLYISPWLLEKIISKITAEFPKAKIVSYMYPIKSLKQKEKILEEKNKIFIYKH